MSNHGAADASEGVQRKVLSAYDLPETSEEVSRRTFMANATMTIGGIIGVVLAVPIVGSLLPGGTEGTGSWSPLTKSELDALAEATSKPVKLTFTLKYKDGYLPTKEADEYVWGIKIDEAKFQAARPDIYKVPGGNTKLSGRQLRLRDLQPNLSASRLPLQLELVGQQVPVSVPRVAI